MARIRTVKPELFQSYTIKRLSLEARWTFIGLLTHVDDDGYCRDEPRIIKGAIWPLEDDVTWSDVAKHIEELLHAGLVCRFFHNGVAHIHVVTFKEHQKINRATKSKLPHCPKHAGLDPSGSAATKPESRTETTPHPPLTESSVSTHAPLTEDSSTEVEVEVEREVEKERELDPAALSGRDDQSAGTGSDAPAVATRGTDPGMPPVWAIPLIDQLTAEGFVVAWDLSFVDWDTVRVAIDRSGIPAMIQHVHRRHQAARTPAYSARAWVKDWSKLPALDAGAALVPPASNVVQMPAQRPSTTDARVSQVHAVAAEFAAEIRSGVVS